MQRAYDTISAERALQIIEGIASIDPSADIQDGEYTESQKNMIDIYQIAHTVLAPYCIKNHLSFAARTAELEDTLVDSGIIDKRGVKDDSIN